MEWVDSLVTFASHYNAISGFINFLAAFAGVMAIIYAGKLMLDLHVFNTAQPGQVTSFKIIAIMLMGAALIAYAWTMNVIAGSVFDYENAFTVDDFASTREFTLDGGSSPTKILQDFALLTCAILGKIFGFWGLINLWMSRTPGGKMEQFWTGLARLGAAVIFSKPKEFFNLFGDMGTRFFG